MKLTYINKINMLLACVLALDLAACGGGSVGSNAGSSGTGFSANADSQILVTPHSHSTEMGSLDYQNVRALNGTGIGGTLSPSDLVKHYNLPSTLNGAKQTIAIVDAPGSGNPATDLNIFSTYYNLPMCNTTNPCFSHIDMSNGAAVSANNDWKYEISLDTQWAHAIAPASNIVLVTAKSSALADIMEAIQIAAAQPGVVAISMSFGAGEFNSETSAAFDGVLKTIQASGIVLLASSGDAGNNGTNQEWPAASPYVTSVGGTSIKSVGYLPPSVASEIAWAFGGGGASLLEAIPSYQSTYLAGTKVIALDKTKRAIPDIAYNADPNYSPVAVVVSGGWWAIGGTSAGAPQWAAIVSLIAQQRTTKGESSMQTLVKGNSAGFNGIIYQAKLDSTSFFDITAGTDDTARTACALCTAGKGYDAVTGLGVPNVTNMLTFF